jgi:hypothetical protein
MTVICTVIAEDAPFVFENPVFLSLPFLPFRLETLMARF